MLIAGFVYLCPTFMTYKTKYHPYNEKFQIFGGNGVLRTILQIMGMKEILEGRSIRPASQAL